ncbi:hypothetical protein [Streptomyces sp. NPDC091209]|uniref:hypothetical protein n=1 Tax=Streptomyces sp. NPDC091209 TaxID=3365974 RepID=UPI00382F6633
MTTAHAWRSASQGLLERRRSASGADGCYARRTAPARPVADTPSFQEDATSRFPEDATSRFPEGGASRFPEEGAAWFPEEGAAWFPEEGAAWFPEEGAAWFREAPLPPGLLPLPHGFELRGA